MIKNLISRWTMVRTTREGFWDSIENKKYTIGKTVILTHTWLHHHGAIELK